MTWSPGATAATDAAAAMRRRQRLAAALADVREGRCAVDEVLARELRQPEEAGLGQTLADELRAAAAAVLEDHEDAAAAEAGQERGRGKKTAPHGRNKRRGRSRRRKGGPAQAPEPGAPSEAGQRKPNAAFGRRNLRSPIANPVSASMSIAHDASGVGPPRLAFLELAPRDRRQIGQLAQLYALLVTAGCMRSTEAELAFLCSLLARLESRARQAIAQDARSPRTAEAAPGSASAQARGPWSAQPAPARAEAASEVAPLLPGTQDGWVHFACVAVQRLEGVLLAFGPSLFGLLVQFQTLQVHAGPVVQRVLLRLDTTAAPPPARHAPAGPGASGVGLPQPFRPETDSRLHFKNNGLATVFSNREKTRDSFLSAFRKFQAVAQGPEAAEARQDIVRYSVPFIVANLGAANTYWFAQLFVSTMLQSATAARHAEDGTSNPEDFFLGFVGSCTTHACMAAIETVTHSELIVLGEKDVFGAETLSPLQCAAHVRGVRSLGRLLGALGNTVFAWLHDPVFQERSEALSVMVSEVSDMAARARFGSQLAVTDHLRRAQAARRLAQTVPWTVELLRARSRDSIIWANEDFQEALRELARIRDRVSDRSRAEQAFVATEIEALFAVLGARAVAAVVSDADLGASEKAEEKRRAWDADDNEGVSADSCWSATADHIVQDDAFASEWPALIRLRRGIAEALPNAKVSEPPGAWPSNASPHEEAELGARIVQAEAPRETDAHVQRALATAFLHRNPSLQSIVDFATRHLADGYLESVLSAPGHALVAKAVAEAAQKHPGAAGAVRAAHVALHKASDALLAQAQDQLRGPAVDLVRASCAAHVARAGQYAAVQERAAAIALSQACERVSFALQSRLPRVIEDLVGEAGKAHSAAHKSKPLLAIARGKPSHVVARETVDALQRAPDYAAQLAVLRGLAEGEDAGSLLARHDLVDHLNAAARADILVLDL